MAAEGEALQTASNRPLTLDDPDSIWFVEKGAVDVFFVEQSAGRQTAPPRHVLHAKEGRLLMSAGPRKGDDGLLGDDDYRIVARGLQNSIVRRADVSILDSLDSAEAARQIDLWVDGVTQVFTGIFGRPPRPEAVIRERAELKNASGALSVRRGVVWATLPEPDSAMYQDLIPPHESRDGSGSATVPLTPESWLNLLSPETVSGRSSKQLADEGILGTCARDFNDLVFAALQTGLRLLLADDVNLQREGATHRQDAAEGATEALWDLVRQDGDRGGANTELRAVLAVISHYEDIPFTDLEDRPEQHGSGETDEAAGVFSVRTRSVSLDWSTKWWIGDAGAMLGFRVEDDTPVALIPGRFGRYLETSSMTAPRRLVTAARAKKLQNHAIAFYPPLDRKTSGIGDLLKLAKHRVSNDIWQFLGAGLLARLVLLAPAIMVGLITGRVIPGQDVHLLYPAIFVLITVAVVSSFLHVLQGTALTRMEGRMTARIESGIWDRIFRLPAAFLRRHPVGEIVTRGMAFRQLREAVSGAVADSLISVVFLLPAFLLMAAYDPLMAGISSVIGLVSLVVIVSIGLRQIPWHRKLLASENTLSALLFQMVNDITKIRVSGAEPSVFAKWARSYRDSKSAEIGVSKLNEHLVAFATTIPLLSAAVLFTFADPARMAIGDFLLIFSALMIFQGAVVRLGGSFTAVASVGPAFDIIKPILVEETEDAVVGAPVTALSGEIRFERISFRYDAESPLVLKEVSLHAMPGEFVAIVGESGSGKSTLLRIALGIEKPLSGLVYYDGRDMAHLDLAQLRRQIGADPQESGMLMPENIRDNITGGASGVSEEDVWAAAKLAVIDQEIARMPMGLETPVGLCRATLSGGETQRIHIAAALLGNPQIVMFDESTHWLDNESQAKVMKSIEGLNATRLIITHRLSTLRNADRIYVLANGTVAQEGSFDELTNIEGQFQDIMRRQEA